MRYVKLLQVLCLAGSAQSISSDSGDALRKSLPTKQFIIELSEGQDVEVFSSKLASQGIRILKTFNSDVFRGFSIESKVDNIDTLQGNDEVIKAWDSHLIQLDPITPILAKREDINAFNYSQHQWTGVQALHKAGIRGKGAKVAIVDTGVDYLHPALGGGFGSGFKVTGGYDFVGNGNWPQTAPQPDDDPMDQYGHGTHVAGIVAGENEWFTGVAPDAELTVWKVFTNSGSTTPDALIEAFTAAYESGADIITCSVGGAYGFSNNPWALVASRIVDKGVVVTISAGNDGTSGPFYASSGSSGKNVIAVASTTESTDPSDPFELTFTSSNGDTATKTTGYLTNRDPWDVVGWPIWPLQLNTSFPDDGCENVPDELPDGITDLSQTIVLLRRGGCDYTQKEFKLWSVYKATHFMVYNDDELTQAPYSNLWDKPLALIDRAAGEAIVETIKNGGNVTADFSSFPNYKVGMYNSYGGRPSYFTSWGGLVDLDIKPDVAAPGSNILSTYPNNDWAILSGTSMACPYVAGVAALYVSRYGGRAQHKPQWAQQLVNRIISSGAAVPWAIAAPPATGAPPEAAFWAPVAQVGTGLVNASKVVLYETQLSFDKFVLNDTHHFSRYHGIDITNNGLEEVEYTFSVQPGAGFDAKSAHNLGLVPLAEMSPENYVPKIKLPSGRYKVLPGQTKKAEFIFSPLTGLNETALPVYSGKVLVSASNGEELSVPYMGAGFNLQEQFSSIWEGDTPRSQPDNLDVKSNFTFQVAEGISDFPKVIAAFKWGCAELRWDIYEEGWQERHWKYPPVVGKNGYIGSATAYKTPSTLDPDTYDPTYVDPFPLTLIPRNNPLQLQYQYQTYWWTGQLANGSFIAPGNYTWRFAALTPFGIPTRSDNWDIWKTPPIEVLPIS